MSKSIQNVCFDTEVIEWARVHLENISETCNSALKTLMEREKSPTIRLEDLPIYKAQLTEILTQYDALNPPEVRFRILKELARIAQMETSMKFAGVTELDGIRPDQAANTDFMNGLITVLRAKYPALARVDIQTLRSYLDMREATA